METRYKKISDFFNPITNPAGGMPSATPTFGFTIPKSIPGSAPSTKVANSTAPTGNLQKLAEKNAAARKLSELYGGNSAPWMTYNQKKPQESGRKIIMPTVPDGPMSRVPAGPVQPSTMTPGPMTGGGKGTGASVPLFSGGGAPSTAGATEPAVPSQWMRPDGSIKTPEEIAAEVAGALRNTQGNADIGTLAGNQFGGGGKSATDLAADARLINNIRNDIAVGENDPYKVASQSGIAYTPQELAAIEKSYAGIYDPAIVTAQAKLEAKQAEDAAAAERTARLDEMRLQAELDANAPYTLGENQVRYNSKGEPIAMGIGAGTQPTGVYTPGTNPTVDAYVKGIQNKTFKVSDVPDEYKALVAQGLSMAPAADNPQAQYVRTQAKEALTNIDTALGYLEGTSGGLVKTADNPLQRAIFGVVPGSDARNLNSAIDTIKALVGFDALQKMREASPTGGALGNITEKELGYLQSVQGSLDLLQGDEQIIATLNRVRESFQKLEIINSPDGTSFELDGKSYIKVGEEMVPADQYQPMSMGAGNRPQRNNNPLNIKASGVTSQYPGVVGVDPSPATDGGQFLTFASPEAGFQAAKQLITNPNYMNLSVDAAMRRWSNNGYGAEIMPNLQGRAMSSLTPGELDSLLYAMAQKEGYYA